MAKKAPTRKRLEDRTQQIGHELFDCLNRRAPSIFHGRWWEDRLINWAMNDDAIRVQLFRFGDVLPMLRDHESISRHLDEYFEVVRQRIPTAARLGLDISRSNSVLSRALAWNARSNAGRMAKRFIAGTTISDITQSVLKLRRSGFAFTLNHLGQAIASDEQADRYQEAYLDLIDGMTDTIEALPDDLVLDHDHEGPIARVNVSLKASALDGRFSITDTRGTQERILGRLRPILRLARECGAFVNFDMEQLWYRPLTLELFQSVLMEDEFRDWAECGIAVQAYLTDSERELKSLLTWVRKRGTPITVRLIKGDHWDSERNFSAARNWPLPVYRRKWQTDASFESMTDVLMKNYDWLRPAIASHSLRSLARALASAELHKVPARANEIHMLYGVSDPRAQIFAERGQRVRISAPFGELIPGLACLVRRLLENTSNDSFLRQSFSELQTPEVLLMSPASKSTDAPDVDEPAVAGFRNEPPTDFSIAASREAMQQALDEVRESFGQQYSLIIGGKACDSRTTLDSRNPSNTSEIVGRVAAATADQAIDAIDSARRAFPGWAATETSTRVEYLQLIAAEMRERRFELAAWVCLESGKPWEEADADVTQAIDFCMYYSDQMLKLDEPQRCDLPGEENTYSYRPRGVAVVIAPWNFPLSILTGMTAAAMVSGNTVVMKPAEQSSVVAAQLMEIIRNAHVPEGVVNFLPGIGEELGPVLTGSPQVDIVAFTGSTPVGLEINHIAAETGDHQPNVKKVIVEMGGKNAIIVDDDADLDEAVSGVVRSAFGYAGQKLVLCHAHDLGLAGKTGSGTENRNGPKGALHFRYLTPFSSERFNPAFCL
jgi:RHH-type proline utilization regulon transcriptional repressor/proline dehydrogenase/delta 1-pyrroline-5-carboxylate dehydrogenase